MAQLGSSLAAPLDLVGEVVLSRKPKRELQESVCNQHESNMDER
jgi:hypothetical protein